ncbi:MAG: trypsin-like peptidase domain-containing protein [Trueperaceae bacterium]|nr:trypsin-like peptidase domain-containing protein [Trueperaceae bacterium]
MNSDDLIRGVVRVWNDDGSEIVGTGVLVAPDLVLTCAHVAAKAWGVEPDVEEGLGRRVRIDLPAVAPLQFLDASVTHWLPRRPAPGGAYDLAGLRLGSRAPLGAKPVPLVVEEVPWGRPSRIFGFPGGRPDGSYASGTLRDALANGWVLIKGEAEAREFTRPGYSGGPVVTEAGVVGLLTEGDRDVRVREAVMVPVRTILGAWPELHGIVARSPYPGLAPFTARDVPYFHGRARLAEELAAAIDAPPHLLVLAGPSGSGKSSLLAAGVLPLLEKRDESCRSVLWTPGKAPYATLARALMRARDPEAEELRISVESARLARDLESGRVALADLLAQDIDTRWVVAVDQPEELLLDNGHPAAYVPPARRLFDDLLAVLTDERAAGRLAVIVAVRTDYLDALLRSPRLQAHGGEIVRYLGPVDELREVIEAPLLESGVSGLEAGLTDRILADVGDVPNPLPLLQFTLAALWRNQRAGRLTHAAYDELGGVRRALANHAERTVAAFSEEELTAARDVLLQLGRPGLDDSVARRAARFDELGERGRSVVARLADARLVVTDRDADGVERVEVVHETLFEHWPRLRTWWLESVDFRRWQESLRFALRVWRDGGEHPTDLLRGPRLRAAETHLRTRAAAFTTDELSFVMLAGDQEARESEAAQTTLKRQLQLRRRLNVLLGVGMAVAVILAAVTVWQMSSVQRLRADTERLLHSTSEANAALGALAVELDDSLGESRVLLARRLGIQAVAMSTAPTTFGGDMRLAALMASHAVRLDPAPESYDYLLRVLQANPNYRATLAATATATALSPDGRTVAVGDAEGFIEYWDGITGARQSDRVKAYSSAVTALAYSPDGQALVSGGADGRVVVWEADTLRRRLVLSDGGSAPLAVVAATADGRTWLGVDLIGQVRAWDATSGRLLATLGLDGAGAPVRAAGRDQGIPVLVEATDGYDPDGALAHAGWTAQLALHPSRPLIAVTRIGRVAVLDASTLGEMWSVPLIAGDLGGLAFDSGGDELVLVGFDGRLHVWSVEGRPLYTWQSRVPDVRVVVPGSESGTLLLAVGGGAQWVDYRTGALVGPRLQGHDQALVGVTVMQDLIVTRSREGRVVTWDREPREPLDRFIATVSETPSTMAMTQDSSHVFIGGDVGNLFSVSLVEAYPDLVVRSANDGGILGIVVSGDQLATVGRDGKLVLRDVTTLAEDATLFTFDAPLRSVAVHPTQAAVVIGGTRGLVEQVMWDGTGSARLRPPSRAWSAAVNVAVSPDGRTFAFSIAENLELWRDGQVVARAVHIGDLGLKKLMFDVSGTRLLGTGSGRITVWTVPSLSVVATWHPSNSASLSPDGTWLAVANPDYDVQLYDAATLTPIGRPLPNGGLTFEVMAFTPDGKQLVIANDSGRVVAWNTDRASWLRLACNMAWRDLTGGEAARIFPDNTFEPVCEVGGG